MQLKHKTHFKLPVCLLAVSVFALSGCRSGGFPKPDLAKLAFWKKDTALAQSVPPPPARHFDPAPLNGSPKDTASDTSAVVDLDTGTMKKRFENNIDQALSDIKSAAREPIRKPYSTDLESSENKVSANQFSPQASQNRPSGLGGFTPPKSSAVDTTLSLAQQEFNAAMKQTAGAANEFAPKTGSSNEFTKGWKDDIKLPTGLASTKNSVDQSLASVNESLNNANRRMGEVGSNALNSFQAKTNELNNKFQSTADTAAKSANDFVANGKDKLNSAIKPITGIASNNNFAPPGVPSNAGSSASTKPASGSGDIDLVQAQVAEAKQQIERLKMQVEEAKRKERLSAAAGQTNAQPSLTPAPAKVAQLEMPTFKSAYTNPGSVGNQSGKALPNQPQLPNVASPQLPATPPASNFSPNYPSTAHGGFAPKGVPGAANSNFAPAMKNAPSQVSFQSNSNKSNVVTANSPSSSDSASRIQNFVSEVDIPDSVLRGSGSYAPGSVNVLRK